MVDKGACWRCRHHEDEPDDKDGGVFCVRYPPICAYADGDMLVMWPVVDALDRCGEFEKQEDER